MEEIEVKDIVTFRVPNMQWLSMPYALIGGQLLGPIYSRHAQPVRDTSCMSLNFLTNGLTIRHSKNPLCFHPIMCH